VNSLIPGQQAQAHRGIDTQAHATVPRRADRLGLPGFEFNSWFAVLAPVGASSESVAKLNGEIVEALAHPALRDQLVAQGLTPRGSGADKLGRATKDQLAKQAP
jgi:tripartite-type tricarboxylate transporter receptor subunit TctC